MTGRKYLKQMFALSEELGNTAGTEPYDPHAYNLVIDKINNLNHLWFVSLGRKHWFIRIVWVLLCLLLAWLFYSILS